MKRLINKQVLLVGTALTSLLSTACVQVATEESVETVQAIQPNIVHIFTDDMGWQDIGCYYRAIHGEEAMYETPHMDRLAKNGKRFMQAYSPAPTCAPSRAAYMAGQYTPHTGVLHVMGGRLPRVYHDSCLHRPVLLWSFGS